MQTIQVFISSPNDLAPERAAALWVIERLRRQFHGRALFEPYLWEYDSYESSRAFQEQIPRASEFDVVVVILWSKRGWPITVDGVTYPSGTVFEYFDALRGAAEGHTRLLVYRKTTEPPTSYRSQTIEAIVEAKSKFDEVDRFFQDNFDDCEGGVRGFNRFEATDAFEEALEKELRKHIDTTRSPRTQAVIANDSPYRGLKLFDEEHQHFFFGRTRAVYQVVASLQRQAAAGRPFIVVFGRSGVGKSSFIRAGVAPYLTGANVIEDVAYWRRALFEPSDSTENLVGGLALAICADEALPEVAVAAGGKAEFAALLRKNTAAAAILIKQTLREAATAQGAAADKAARLLVLVDPLEEMFTHRTKEVASALEAESAARQEKGQREFAKVLHDLCTSGVLWVVATLRSDFYEQASAIQELRELKEGEGQYHLAPLSPSEITQAVTLPAEIAGVVFEQTAERGSLATEIVDSALNHTYPLPLLSYTLDQLFERSDASRSGCMTFKAFDHLGKVDGALSRRADEAHAAAREQMTGKPTDCLDKVFGLLVDIDRDGRRVRLYAPVEKFDDHDSQVLRSELDRARLLITDMDDQRRPVVSIAHETMLSRWTTLRDWIDDREEQLRLRGMLDGLAKDWAPTQDPEFLVLQGARLARAEQFVKEPRGIEIEPAIRKFVVANARRAKLHWRLLFGVISAACVAAFVACGIAVYKERQLSREQLATENVSGDLRETVGYMLTVLDKSLDTHNDHERKLKNEIGNRVAEHYQKLDISNASPELLLKTSAEMENGAEMLAHAKLSEPAALVMQRSIDVCLASNHFDPDQLADRWDVLGDLYFYQSRYDDEERAYQTSVKVRDEAGLKDSPKNQHALAGLAAILKTKGQYAEAADRLQKCIKALRAAGPKMEEELAKPYDQLADILRSLQRFKECEQASKQAISLAEKLAKDEPPKSARARAVLGYQSEYAVMLQKVGQVPQAEKMLLDLQKKYEDIALDQDYGRILYKLARVQIELKEYDAADASLAASYKQMKPNESPMAKCLEARARLRLAQKRYADAEADARGALQIREKKLSGPHPDLFEAELMLADAMEAQGNHDQARIQRQDALALKSEFQKQIDMHSERDDKQASSM